MANNLIGVIIFYCRVTCQTPMTRVPEQDNIWRVEIASKKSKSPNMPKCIPESDDFVTSRMKNCKILYLRKNIARPGQNGLSKIQ